MSYTIRFESGDTLDVDGDLDDARREAREAIEAGESAGDTTVWYDAVICDEDGDEVETVTVAIDPDEPACTRDAGHVWKALHRVVGGIASNPGVQGHGGGVVLP